MKPNTFKFQPRLLFALCMAMVMLTLCGCSNDLNQQSGIERSLVGADSTRLILLGTAGGPAINGDREQPSSLLVVKGRPYLIDCGVACVAQLKRAGFDANTVRQLFITHMHLDHTAGVASLAAYSWTAGKGADLSILGPPGTEKLVEAGLAYLSIPGSVHASEVPSMGNMRDTVQAIDLNDVGELPVEIYSDDRVRVLAVKNSHFDHMDGKDIGFGPVQSYSYRFETSDRSFVFTGDTGESIALERLAAGADVLVSEVMDVDGLMGQFRARNLIPEKMLPAVEQQMRAKHLTPEAVGELAQVANVKTVILTHYSVATDGSTTDADMIARVKNSFKGLVLVGSDLRQF